MAAKDNSVKAKTGLELKAQAAALRQPAAKTRAEQLDEYREVVVTGQRNFVTVGTALGLIAKERLFKEAGFKSFEAMVVAEFDMGASTAYRLVDAARVVTILSQVGTIESRITNQSQALALAPLVKDREAMVLTITAAEARAGKLTADLLAEVRVELYPHTRVIDGEVVPEKPALVKGMRKAIERAAASVGTGVTYEPPDRTDVSDQTAVDPEHCEKCRAPISAPDQQGGYRRCPKCDPSSLHVGEVLDGGDWGACGRCKRIAAELAQTSAAGPAATETAGSGDGPSPVAGPGLPQTAAEGLTHPEADGAEVDGTTAGHAFRSGDAPAPTGADLTAASVGVTHEQENGWAGPNGDCGASCTCGVMFDGFDTIAEARQLLERHIANPEERDEEEAAGVEEPPACEKCGTTFVLADPYLAPAHYLRCGACDPYRTHYRTSLPDGPCQICGPTISPAADAMAPPSPQQPGPDSPTGSEGSRSETIHHTSAGVSDVGGAPEVTTSVEQGLEDGGTAQDLPSSSDPEELPEAARLLKLVASLVLELEHFDVEAVAQQLYDREVQRLHDYADAVAEFVGRVDSARTP